jgi:hypothetical protein
MDKEMIIIKCKNLILKEKPRPETTDQEEVKKLINMFLDWKNNFLTVGRFAEYYSLTIEKQTK